MINPINYGRRDPVSLRGTGGPGGGAPAAAASAMATVASRLGARLSAELRLADVEADGGGRANDLYGVEELAAELATALGGGPADHGQLARALHDFARESAVLLAARPEAGSVARMEAAIGQASAASRSGAEVTQAIASIDDATGRIMAAAR